MANFQKPNLQGLKTAVQKGAEKVDASGGKEMLAKAATNVAQKAGNVKESAMSMKEDINDKLTELDRQLEQGINEYNNAYTLMNDKGLRLFVERTRAVDVIGNVEVLVNSIANKPASFTTDFEEITTSKQEFTGTCEFAERELQAARDATIGAGAGLAAGASVTFMAPTAAMWVATTFGTASTGTAISSLTGAAATNAALAWLGGGAITAGGGGMAAGNALLALSGPIGWSIAGATLLTSIVLFSKKKAQLNSEKNEQIESVKRNTEKVMEMDAKLQELLSESEQLREGVSGFYVDCLPMFAADYSTLDSDRKKMLGNLVQGTKALAKQFEKKLEA